MSDARASRDQPELAIDGATIVTPEGRRQASLFVSRGRIVAIGPADVLATRRVDAAGLLALPGFVDTHLHFMEPADPSREDWTHGTAAAAASGVTTIVEHTHAAPARDADELGEKIAWLDGRSQVDYGLAVHAWPDRIGSLEGAWRRGAAFVKVFTCTTHGVPAIEGDLLAELFRATARIGMPSLVHCEDERLVAEAEATLRAQGRTDPGLLPAWRNREAEDAAVAAVLRTAGTAGARVAVAHASRVDVVDAIDAAARVGTRAVAESCPQYFTLFEQEIDDLAGLRKFTPPARARTPADQARMWEALADGRIHHVSSDHAPSTRAQKGDGGIWDVHFGLPGLDTTSSILVDAALTDLLTLERLVEAYAAAPARLYGLTRKGRLAVGADADVVLIDPTAERILDDRTIRSKAGWTPYAGRRVRGAVVATYLRGQVIFEAGAGSAVLGSPAGTFIPGAGTTLA